MNLGQWLGFLGIAIALYILWQIRQILLLVFTAVVLATALNSLVRWLRKKLKLRRGIAVFLTVLVTLLVLTLFVGLIAPPFIDQFQKLVKLLPAGLNQSRDSLNTLRENLPPWAPDIPEIPEIPDLLAELQPSTPQLRSLFGNFFEFFQNTLATVLRALLVFVIALMLLADPPGYRRAFLQLFPSFYRRRADSILSECEVALGNWLAGILVNSLFVGSLSGLGLFLLGIPFVLAHALLAGLLNFIPNIGPTLSVVFPLSVALLEAPWKAIAVLALYIVIQQVESYWLTPTVMAHQVSLLPAVTLVAQIFFASTFGILGLLMALPLTVIAKVWIQEALVRDVLNRCHRQRFEAEVSPAEASPGIEKTEEMEPSLPAPQQARPPESNQQT